MINRFSANCPIRQALIEHTERLSDVRISALFDDNPDRFKQFSRSLGGLLVDFSKNRVDAAVMESLLDLARSADLELWRDDMFTGQPVNSSEERPALHVALRDPEGPPLNVEGIDVRAEVQQGLDTMSAIVDRLRSGAWLGATDKPITDVVHIGIGGSILGPEAVVRALAPDDRGSIRVHFVSNVDAADLIPVLRRLNPQTTLVITVSKSFTTLETLTNATTARQWLSNALPAEGLGKHLMAITADHRAAQAFGVPEENTLGFWPWVGGRFSLWSTVGLPIALIAGMDAFHRLLSGARALDEHFATAPLSDNLPVLMAVIGIWNANFQGVPAHAVLPYDDRLSGLPAHLQQLEMESTGKSMDREGGSVDWETAPIIFGMSGTDAQHTFFQAIHQGTRVVSADFIGSMRDDHGYGEHGDGHHEQLLANLFAQSEALMLGRLENGGGADAQRVCLGNRPSNTILLNALEPETLGMLLALYEHKVFVQGVIWGINPFDQWGVELGKQLGKTILSELRTSEPVSSHDSSTNALINHYLDKRRDRT